MNGVEQKRAPGVNPASFWFMVAALAAIAVLVFSQFLGVPGAVNAILTVSLGFLFILVHGSIAWGWKNIIAFIVITFAISFAAEAIGVATGWVFGPYHYTDHLGPKILGVPPIIQLAYIAVGYSSVTIARLVLSMVGAIRGWAILAATLAGAMIMVSWDVCMDPGQSTAAGDWIWHTGGPYFGVGIHNYVGWFCTVFLFMLVYYVFATRNPEMPRLQPGVSARAFWAMPPIYYALMALNVIVGVFPGGISLPYASPANYSGTPAQMAGSMALVAVFVMGTPVVLALSRIFTRADRVETLAIK